MDNVGYDDIDEMVEENAIEQDDYTEETYNQYIGAEVMVTHGDEKICGKVVKRAKGEDGNPIGRRHQNPLLDTHEYIVEQRPNMLQMLLLKTCTHNVILKVLNMFC